MKNLILIGGTERTDKVTVSKLLMQQLNNAVILDGDWCGQTNLPFTNNNSQKMVMDNIIFLLNSFIKNSELKNIIFYWKLDQQKIIDEILAGLDLKDVKVTPVSIIPSLQNFTNENKNDDEFQNSIANLLKYQLLSTIKYDNSAKSAATIASEIISQL
ncbi:MAG TPA: hypothetical protein DEQ50_07220 [Lactobacillus sp.]|nr:hypothetical protein [Lactobacillus sp.]